MSKMMHQSLRPATNTFKTVLLGRLIQSHVLFNKDAVKKETTEKQISGKCCWNTLLPLILSSPILTHLVFTFYCRTLVLMSMPTVLQLLCGSCWLVVQSHRHFITNQSLFALPNKQRYCRYHWAMCLHLVTQVTLSSFVCTLPTFLQIQDLLNVLHKSFYTCCG